MMKQVYAVQVHIQHRTVEKTTFFKAEDESENSRSACLEWIRWIKKNPELAGGPQHVALVTIQAVDGQVVKTHYIEKVGPIEPLVDFAGCFHF